MTFTSRRLVVLILATTAAFASGIVRAQTKDDLHSRAVSTPPPDPVALNLELAASPGRAAALRYESESKSVLGALALELLVFPCTGSIYAGDTNGALVTGGGLALAFGLGLYGLPAVLAGLPDQSYPSPKVDNAGLRVGAFLGAMGLALASRIYGVYNAVAATNRYNDGLRKALGLTPTISFAQDIDSGRASDVVVPGVAGQF